MQRAGRRFGRSCCRWLFPACSQVRFLALSRAIGETAPLIVVGALAYVTFLPDSPASEFTVLPHPDLQLGVATPEGVSHQRAAAGIVVLLLTMLVLNAFAVWLRSSFTESFLMVSAAASSSSFAKFSVKELSAWFGDKRVLTDVRLDVPEHTVTAIIGPSGCGKSTFIRCLNRMHEMVPRARSEGHRRARR